jgi:hypothetical protein
MADVADVALGHVKLGNCCYRLKRVKKSIVDKALALQDYFDQIQTIPIAISALETEDCRASETN